jgi:hypothetical protein
MKEKLKMIPVHEIMTPYAVAMIKLIRIHVWPKMLGWKVGQMVSVNKI